MAAEGDENGRSAVGASKGSCKNEESALIRGLESVENILALRKRADDILKEGFAQLASARHCAERANGKWTRAMLPVYHPKDDSPAKARIRYGELISPCSHSFRDLVIAAVRSRAGDVDEEHADLLAMDRETRNKRVKKLCSECGWHSRSVVGNDGLEYEAFSPEASMHFLRRDESSGNAPSGETKTSAQVDDVAQRFASLGFTTKRQSHAGNAFAAALGVIVDIAEAQTRLVILRCDAKKN